MNKAEFLRLHQPFLKNGELNQSFESDLNLLLEQYAQQVSRDNAPEFLTYMLCQYKFDDLFDLSGEQIKQAFDEFSNHQNQER